MSGFNQDYQPIRIIDPAIRGYTAGNVPSSWTLYDNAVTPGDIQVRDAQFGGIGVGVNVMFEPSSAANAPVGYYADSFITNGVTPHRISGIVRAAANTNPNVGGGRGLIGLIYGTRFNSDSFFSAPAIFVGVDAFWDTTNLTKNGIFVSVTESGASQVSRTLPRVMNGNSWYTVGIEVLAQTVNFYIDLVNQDNPDNLVGASNLSLVYTYQLQNSKGMEGPTVLAGGGMAGAYAAADWSGFGDCLLEELEGPAGSGGKGNAPPSDKAPLFPIGGVPNFGATLNFPDIPVAFNYTRWKAVKDLQKIYNNLDLNG